jgi:hypothetical protein
MNNNSKIKRGINEQRSKRKRKRTRRNLNEQMNENNIPRSKGTRLIELGKAPTNKGTRTIKPRKENQEKHQ